MREQFRLRLKTVYLAILADTAGHPPCENTLIRTDVEGSGPGNGELKQVFEVKALRSKPVSIKSMQHVELESKIKFFVHSIEPTFQFGSLYTQNEVFCQDFQTKHESKDS